MKRELLLVTALTAAATASTESAASLWSVGGPEAGNVVALASAPPSAVVYAATGDSGVWKSVDSGAHWSRASNGLPEADGTFVSIDSISVDPSNPATAYVGYFAKGFYRTSDGGTSWNAAGSGLPFGVEAIAVDPTASSVVLAGTSNGAFRSSDHGATFMPTTGTAGVPVTALAFDPKQPLTVLAGTNFAGLYASFDGGLSWGKNPGTDLDADQIRSVFFDLTADSRIYIAGIHDVYEGNEPTNTSTAMRAGAIGSSRSGVETPKSWVVNDIFHLVLYVGMMIQIDIDKLKQTLAVSSTPIFVVTQGGGIYVSMDGGTTFAPSNTGLPSATINALAPGEDAIVAGSADLGFARSTDGSHWTESNAGFIASEIFAVAVSKSSPNIVYAATGSTIFRSVDSGVSWQNLTSIGVDQQVFPALAVDPTNPSIVYAATDEHGAIKTTNGGSSWTAANTDITTTGVDCFAILPSSPQTVYAGTDSGIFKTTDGGAHWAALAGASGLPTVRSLAIDPTTAGTILAGTDDGIFRSTDGGGHWSDVGVGSNAFLETEIHSIAIDPAAHTHVYLATHNGLWKSTDGGTSWTEIDSSIPSTFGQPDSPAIVIEPGSKIDAAVVGTQIGPGNGVYRSTDGGATWTALDAGLTIGDIDALAVSSGSTPILYAGTVGGGVFRSPAAPPPPPPGKRKIIPAHPAPPKRVKPEQ